MKFLFISYYFPPEPFAASIRAYNYIKYLKDFTEPVILTKKLPKKILKDDFLIEDLINVKIERVFDYLIFLKTPLKIKNRGGRELKRYLRPFYKRAKTILKEENFKFIFVTIPPFELLKVALSLKRRFNLPLICEIRDPADFESGKKFKKFIKNSENIVDLFIGSHFYVLKSFNIKGYVLHGGTIEFEKKSHEGFNIIYTGTLKNAIESFERFVEFTESVNYNLYLLGPEVRLKDRRIKNIGYVEYKNLKNYFEIADLFIIFRDSDTRNYIPLKFFEYSGSSVPILAYFKNSSNLFSYLVKYEKGKGFVWGEEDKMLKFIEDIKKGKLSFKKAFKPWKEVSLELLKVINEKVLNRNNRLF